MKRKYEMLLKQNVDLRISQSAIIKELTREYPYTFKMACYLLKTVLGLAFCKIDLVDTTFLNFSYPNSVFKLTSQNMSAFLHIMNDKIVIETPQEEYHFKISLVGNKGYANLQRHVIKGLEQTIIESFPSHRLVCEKRTATSTYILDISYDSAETLDYDVLSEVAQINNIEDLRRLYFLRFYNVQKPWEKREKNEVSTFEDINGNQVLMDKYRFNKEGLVSEYLLSSKVGSMIVKKEGTITSDGKTKKENGTFGITNYDVSCDINSVLQELESRSHTLNSFI